jgi:hypothetical protein
MTQWRQLYFYRVDVILHILKYMSDFIVYTLDSFLASKKAQKSP